MAKIIRVKPYKRKVGKKVYTVKPHRRRKKKVGKKVTRTKKVGTFVVQFDKYGNLKGSKVIPFKRKK